MIEKRAYQRFEVHFLGWFKAFGVSEDSFETTILSMGREGLCFYSSIKLKENQGIELEIQLANEKNVKVKGVTVWSDKKDESGFYRVGLKLIKTGSDDERALMDFCKERELAKKQNKKKILVIDDEIPNQLVCEEILHFYNYEVVTANNGAEAISKFAEIRGKCKVVLTDIMMPVMDGKTASTAIRKLDPTVKIIAMSGLMQESKNDNDNTFFDYFLHKPFTGRELIEAVQKVTKTIQSVGK